MNFRDSVVGDVNDAGISTETPTDDEPCEGTDLIPPIEVGKESLYTPIQKRVPSVRSSPISFGLIRVTLIVTLDLDISITSMYETIGKVNELNCFAGVESDEG